MSTHLQKRAFYLMMSVPDGEDLGIRVGLLPPSAEVAAKEMESADAQWQAMYDLGILDSALEASEWFADLSTLTEDPIEILDPDFIERLHAQGLSNEDITANAHRHVHQTIAAFGLALVHKLMAEGLIFPTPRPGMEIHQRVVHPA